MSHNPRTPPLPSLTQFQWYYRVIHMYSTKLLLKYCIYIYRLLLYKLFLYRLLLLFFMAYYNTSARPEVRGTADVGWRSLNPLPKNPPRTHSRLYHHMCLRTDGRWRTWMERDADAALRTILTQFVEMGVVYAVGPVRPPHSAPNTNYHLLG